MASSRAGPRCPTEETGWPRQLGVLEGLGAAGFIANQYRGVLIIYQSLWPHLCALAKVVFHL